MVLFAGIAAEALVYGEAEGGENDENLFRSISVLLRPPLTISQVHSGLVFDDYLAYHHICDPYHHHSNHVWLVMVCNPV